MRISTRYVVCLKNRHLAYQAYVVLELIGVIDASGMKSNRMHINKMMYADMADDTCFIRPFNGHSSPGIRCPESIYMRITDLSAPGGLRYSVH
eukprot:7371144-Pyramimonas_sp.AAC.1